ncbi:MAG: hypothetical protein LWX07_03215, partial [Bacteroidetes bacterium]|nr:hypothetical protein [Bacteroidota bacterium]
MLINNLFFLLKSFDSDDWYECGKFVTSPYFVSGETNYRLFRAAKKYFTDKRRIKITNGSFETFFMNTGELKFVSKQTSHNRLSSFYKILKKFLQYKKVKPLDLYINMQGEYLSRNLLNGFADNLKTEE